jgi:hypothetical protein
MQFLVPMEIENHFVLAKVVLNLKNVTVRTCLKEFKKTLTAANKCIAGKWGLTEEQSAANPYCTASRLDYYGQNK